MTRLVKRFFRISDGESQPHPSTSWAGFGIKKDRLKFAKRKNWGTYHIRGERKIRKNQSFRGKPFMTIILLKRIGSNVFG